MKTHYLKLTPKVKLTLLDKEKIFGKGIAELLHLVDKHDTLQKACKEMEMSYTKAWKIIKRLEDTLGYEIVAGKAGGAKGGVSSLTPEGKDLLKRYDMMAKDLDKYASKIYKKYFSDN